MQEGMRIRETRYKENVIIFEIIGKIEAEETYRILEKRINQVVRNNNSIIIFDLKELTCLDCFKTIKWSHLIAW